jgi:hypothetical protein
MQEVREVQEVREKRGLMRIDKRYSLPLTSLHVTRYHLLVY